MLVPLQAQGHVLGKLQAPSPPAPGPQPALFKPAAPSAPDQRTRPEGMPRPPATSTHEDTRPIPRPGQAQATPTHDHTRLPSAPKVHRSTPRAQHVADCRSDTPCSARLINLQPCNLCNINLSLLMHRELF